MALVLMTKFAETEMTMQKLQDLYGTLVFYC